MKTQVFVLVPYDVPPADIGEFARLHLNRHQTPADAPHLGRFDYLVGPL